MMFCSSLTPADERYIVPSRRITVILSCFAIGIALFPRTTVGVTINVSLAPGSDLPGFDPTGAKLVAIIDAAGQYWSDIILDQFVYNVQVGYGTGGSQAFACYASGGGCVDGVVLPTMPNDAFIEFNSLAGGSFTPYYFDSTPNNHSEFELSQTLFRDLSPGNQSFFYDVTPPPPDLFEVGYQGASITGGPADGFVDAYSVALHELGHLLGTLNEIAQPESNDDHYDIDPIFVANNVVRVRTPANDNEHFNSTIALIRSTIGDDVRALPSATDILAIAAGANPKWTNIDLPRKEFLSGTVWEFGFNWLGNRIPNGEDDAFIRHGGAVSVLLDQEAGNLTIAEGSDVTLNNSELTVNGTLRVEGAGGGTATFTVPSGSFLDASTVEVGDEGLFGVDGSIFSMAVTANSFTIEPGGVVIGHGRISADSIVNSGTVTAIAEFDGTQDVLALDATGGGQIDLDGSGGGTLFAVLGSILVSGPLQDAFNGTINIGQSRTVFFNESWTYGNVFAGGAINLNGGNSSSQAATLDSAPWVANRGEINVSGIGQFVGTVDFHDGVDVNVSAGSELRLNGPTTINGGTFTVNEDANIDFNGPTTIHGGTFNTFSTIISDGDVDFNGPTTWSGTATINGIAQQQGDATVSASSVINADAFDMDGSLGSTAWDINARLEVHATRIGNGGSVFNGTLDIGGQLSSKLLIDVENSSQPEWEMAGTMNLGGIVLSFVDRLLGSRVNITGEVNVTNRAGIAADAVLANASTINFNSGVVSPLLRMSGETTVEAGATFAGTGTLENGVSGVMSLAVGLSTGQVGVTNRGRLELGDAVGVVVVDRFENVAGATLVVDVGKNNVATDSDLLRIGAGLAELAGSLQPRVVQLSGKNEPLTPGDSFMVITAFGGVIQTFDDVLPSMQGGLTFQWGVTYNPNDVVIEFASVTGLLGDYNYDGSVNGYDFLKWQRTLGSTTDLMADGNLDGMVNQPDLKIWEDNYGSIFPLEAMNVPEPTAMLLTCVAALMLPRRLRV